MVIYENYSHCGVSNKYKGNGRSDSALPITCLCINTVHRNERDRKIVRGTGE